jgi:hypothetical protein
MRSVESRLAKLEQTAKEIVTASPDTPCICPFGERRFYFMIEGVSEEQAAARYPDNTKHCSKCGGLNHPVHVDENDMDV